MAVMIRTAALLGLLLAAVDAGAAPPPAVAPTESILSEYVPQAAPDPEPPPYTILRYNEDYAVLADPSERTDVFDPAKYIPLCPSDPQRYLSFGGELRERFESTRNPAFHPASGSTSDGVLLQRVVLHADLHLTDRLRFFAQGISGLSFGERGRAPPVNDDRADLEQGFVDYVFGTPTPEGPRLTTRLGRFSMSYGSGRLVATRAGPNIPLKFDGAQFIAASGARRLYGFLVRPVQEDPDRFDRTDESQTFWGLYAALPAPLDRPGTLDVYYFGRRNTDTHYATAAGIEDRHTLGVRYALASGGWSLNWEPIVQFGDLDGRSIRAWTIATDTGYRFRGTGQPRMGLQADIASGDHGAGARHFGAFDPLYFKAGYFNDGSLIRPTNIVDVHPSLQVTPMPSLLVTLASDMLWRTTRRDALYAPNGRVQIPPGGTSRYVGTTAEAAVQWKVSRHVVLTASFVRLFLGKAASTAAGADPQFVGAWATFTW